MEFKLDVKPKAKPKAKPKTKPKIGHLNPIMLGRQYYCR
jgi:hypothetical protein